MERREGRGKKNVDEVTFTRAVYCKTLYEGLILSFEEQEVRMGISEMLFNNLSQHLHPRGLDCYQ